MKKIPVADVRANPPVAASTDIGIKIDLSIQADEAEINRMDSQANKKHDHAERAARIARGEPVPPLLDHTPARKVVLASLGEKRLAKELHSKSHEQILRSEQMTLRKSLVPAYNENVGKPLAEAFLRIHELLVLDETLRNDLHVQGCGFAGTPCTLYLEDVFGLPRDRSSHFSSLLRQCVTAGFISRLPEALR
jgi:hypothetical protein